MWSMELRRPDGKEWSMPRRFEMVKEAGFDGIGLDFATNNSKEVAECNAVGPLFKEYDLQCLLTAFPRSIPDLIPYLEYANKYNCRFVNVIGMIMPLSVEGMIPIVRTWLKMAQDYGVELHFETHRACMTNDMFPTLQLLDAVPEMTMVGDLSHYMVGREFNYPLSAMDQSLMRRLMERCEHFQGRVASREQVQVQLNFPQNRKWLALFEAWWREGFHLWYQRNAGSEKILNFMCELGPPEYAMTGADGYELSDRWEESKQLKDLARKIWSDTVPPKT
eukprot:CAMPEP_0175143618 /NCGR_PEP_ID=MMETSP0087-20121206/13564_1 /TAXON_ID=136419 /ORGANISM="Unknown Unknown, Strain D1" /LENGTH=277 /DNA_ID=CAMNT_0016427771 /DNA_START=141 /DNA_END=974 /DNA_ORIENTATION=-